MSSLSTSICDIKTTLLANLKSPMAIQCYKLGSIKTLQICVLQFSFQQLPVATE